MLPDPGSIRFLFIPSIWIAKNLFAAGSSASRVRISRGKGMAQIIDGLDNLL